MVRTTTEILRQRTLRALRSQKLSRVVLQSVDIDDLSFRFREIIVSKFREKQVEGVLLLRDIRMILKGYCFKRSEVVPLINALVREGFVERVDRHSIRVV